MLPTTPGKERTCGVETKPAAATNAVKAPTAPERNEVAIELDRVPIPALTTAQMLESFRRERSISASRTENARVVELIVEDTGVRSLLNDLRGLSGGEAQRPTAGVRTPGAGSSNSSTQEPPVI